MDNNLCCSNYFTNYLFLLFRESILLIESLFTDEAGLNIFSFVIGTQYFPESPINKRKTRNPTTPTSMIINIK